MLQRDVRILILKDSSADTGAIVRELKNSGLSKRPGIAIEKVFLRTLKASRPDVILTVHAGRKPNDLKVLQLAVQYSTKIPCIATADSLDESTVVDCLRSGVVDYIYRKRLHRFGPAVLAAATRRGERKSIGRQHITGREPVAILADLFERIWDNSPSGVRIINKSDIVLYVNKSYFHLVGMRESELAGRGIKGIIKKPFISEVFAMKIRETLDTLLDITHIAQVYRFLFFITLEQAFERNLR